MQQFTGTTQYFRDKKCRLITDGVAYLYQVPTGYAVVQLVFDALEKLETKDWFVLIKISSEESICTITCEDGNENQYSKNTTRNIKVLIPNLSLYASWDGTNWILMLPSEY